MRISGIPLWMHVSSELLEINQAIEIQFILVSCVKTHTSLPIAKIQKLKLGLCIPFNSQDHIWIGPHHSTCGTCNRRGNSL